MKPREKCFSAFQKICGDRRDKDLKFCQQRQRPPPSPLAVRVVWTTAQPRISLTRLGLAQGTADKIVTSTSGTQRSLCQHQSLLHHVAFPSSNSLLLCSSPDAIGELLLRALSVNTGGHNGSAQPMLPHHTRTAAHIALADNYSEYV